MQSLLLVLALAHATPLPPSNLRVEHLSSRPLYDAGTNPAPLVTTLDASTSQPRFSWAPHHTLRGQDPAAYRVRVARSPQALLSSTLLHWDSGLVASPSSTCEYAGKPLAPATQYFWTVSWVDSAGQTSMPSTVATFDTGLTDDMWNSSTWIEGGGMVRSSFSLTPAQAAAKQARLYVSGIGLFQVHMNNQRVGAKQTLAGAWKTWNKHVLYYTFDVAALLKEGDNGIGISLGHGWRSLASFPPRPTVPCDSHERLARAVLVLDGETVLRTDSHWNATDHTPWTMDSLYNGESFDQRIADEQDGWSAAPFNPKTPWTAATPVDCFKPALLSLTMPGMETVQENPAVSITMVQGCAAGMLGGMQGEGGSLNLECASGTISKIDFASFGTPTGSCPDFSVSDCDANTTRAVVEGLCLGKASCQIDVDTKVFGDPCFGTVKSLAVVASGCTAASGSFVVKFKENLSGWTRMKVNGAAGQVVTLRHAEVLQHPPYGPVDGTIYQGNLRSAKATDTYTLSGNPDGETFEPHFTYHGFQYVQVEGYPGVPSIDDFTQVHFRSNVAVRTSFHSSSDVLDKIQDCALKGQGSNLMSVPTDCDQRDERLGWMGDSDLSCDSMALNFDMDAFADNWIAGIIDEEGADGSLPDVVPSARYGSRPADPSWSAAFPQNVWVKLQGGDMKPAADNWDRLNLYRSQQEAELASAGSMSKWSTSYGDWVPADSSAKVYNGLCAGLNLIENTQQLVDMAKALGKTDEAAALEKRVGELQAEFHTSFFKDGNCYDNCAQAALGAALTAGAVPEDQIAAVAQQLVDDIASHDTHPTFGIIGSKATFPALKATGHMDVAVALAEQTTQPSFGYMIYNTIEPASGSLWELWDADSQGPGMNSRNHHMFSSVSQFIVSGVGGVGDRISCSPDTPLALHPAPVLGVSRADTRVQTRCGEVRLTYERAGGVQCGQAIEGRSALRPHAREDVKPLRLSCGPQGGNITSIDFASWGLPSGSCGAYKVSSVCHSSLSHRLVEAACLGKHDCEVDASAPAFFPPNLRAKAGWNSQSFCPVDTLNSSPRRLFAQVTCSGAPSLHVDVGVPVGAKADVLLPSYASYDVPSSTVASLLFLDEDGNEQPLLHGEAVEGIYSVRAVEHGMRAQLGSGSFKLKLEG